MTTWTGSTKGDALLLAQGGFGKQIAATAVAKAASRVFGRVRVLTSYPEAFAGLPFIDRVWAASPIPYLVDDHRGWRLLTAEPYHHPGYRDGSLHLVSAWCDALGLPVPDDLRGVLKIQDHEHETAMRMLSQVDRSRPWVALQPWGGVPFREPAHAGDTMRPKQERALPREKAQAIASGLRAAGAVVVQISLPTEPALEDVIRLTVGEGQVLHPRVLLAVLNLCNVLVGVDSFAAHAWAALRKPPRSGIVLWGATSPRQLSYPGAVDMVPPAGTCPTPHCGRPDTALPDVTGSGDAWRCPHGAACMASHDVAAVIEAAKAAFPAMPKPAGEQMAAQDRKSVV